jgi:hypothetical protein
MLRAIEADGLWFVARNDGEHAVLESLVVLGLLGRWSAENKPVRYRALDAVLKAWERTVARLFVARRR